MRTTIRIDNNLKTRIELLAVKNNMSFNKMINYIIGLGYQTYIDKFDKYYEEQDKNIRKEGNDENKYSKNCTRNDWEESYKGSTKERRK